MPEISFTQAVLSAFVGGLVSLIFSRFPKVDEWWAGKSTEFKQLFMLGFTIVIGIIIVVLGCTNLIYSDVVCTKAGLVDAGWTIIFAAIGNQIVYKYTPQSSRVKAIKDARIK